MARGMLCLAAVRKWQVKNGRLPESASVALEAAGVDPAIAGDPFTGQEFKLLKSSKSGEEIVVFTLPGTLEFRETMKH